MKPMKWVPFSKGKPTWIWWTSFVIMVVFMVLGSPTAHAAPALDMQKYPGFYVGSNGFIIEITSINGSRVKKSLYDQQGNLILSTNVIEEMSLKVYWHDNIKEFEEEDIDDENWDEMDDEDVTVTYKRNNTTVKAETKSGGRTFVIKNYDLGLTKSGTGKIQLEVSEVDGDKKDTFTIPFVYHLVDTPGSKQKVAFKAGSKIEAFNQNIVLEFPKNSVLLNASNVPAAEQQLYIEVGEQPSSTDTITFVGHRYTVEPEANGAKLSASGTITLTYDENISKETALYNLTVFLYKNGQWMPIGGVVDSAKRTIRAPFHEFGTYAVGLHYTTYSGLQRWAEPYIIPLSNKGVISQALLKRKAQNQTITRFEFTVMLVKALGWKPVPYDGYFQDLSKNHPVYGDDLDYVMAAISKGLVTGRTDHLGRNFMDPDGVLTREYAAVFVSRAMNLNIQTYADLEKTGNDLSRLYVDYRRIGKWAWPNVLAIQKSGIMLGDPTGRFNPKQPLTFAQASTIIYRMMDKMGLLGK